MTHPAPMPPDEGPNASVGRASPRRGPRWFGGLVARTGVSLLALLPGLLVLGALLPRVPYLGLATTVVGAFQIWFVVLGLAAAALAGAVWRGRSRYGNVLVVAGALTALGAAVITGRMVHAVEQAGVDVDHLAAFGIGSASSSEPDAEPVYLTDQGEELRLNVYQPAADADGGDGAPVLMYVHGGGWSSGSRDALSADMRWLADQGYLVLSIDYSLSSPDRHLWNVVQAQVGCALSWVTENAAEYGGDPTRFSLTGESAGGNLAINTGYLAARGRLPSACGGIAPPVAALSVRYPATLATELYDNDDPVMGPFGRSQIRNYTGGSPSEYPERYDAVDSAATITADAPPTLVLTGEADHLVRLETVETFVELADEAGVETSLVSVPYGDHGFDGLLPGGIGSQAFRQLTVNWLGEHGQRP